MAIEDDKIEQHPPKRSKPNLPPEIITEILSRLPVKSLLQFRSVSKSWRSMISDPKFVKTHLTICSKDDENAHHKLIFSSIHRHSNTAFKTCHLSPVLNGFTVNPMGLDYPLKHPNWSVCIVGSINGLICFVTHEQDTFLWNPSTRISTKLPDWGIKLSRDWIVYGFGYDESTDDYNVVVIFRTCHKHLFATEVMVYSSRTGFWRRIGDFPWGICLEESGKFVNGAIHWAAIQKTGSNLSWSLLIIFLDLASETYGEVAQPSYGEGEGEFEMSLGVLGECLCVLYNFHGNHTHVWMMKEYGVRESWTKLTSIPYYMIGLSKLYTYPVLLYMSKNGEILLEFDSHIVMYNPQSKSFKNPDIRNFDGCLQANTYLESLVSPLIRKVLRDSNRDGKNGKNLVF